MGDGQGSRSSSSGPHPAGIGEPTGGLTCAKRGASMAITIQIVSRKVVDLHGRSSSTILEGRDYDQPFPEPMMWGADKRGGLDGICGAPEDRNEGSHTFQVDSDR